MNDEVVTFDQLHACAAKVLDELGALPAGLVPLYLVRDLHGKVRISVSEAIRNDPACAAGLRALADRLHQALGAHSYPPGNAVLFVSDALQQTLKSTARPFHGIDGVYMADRLVTCGDWWTVRPPSEGGGIKRCTLFSVKGGVGRSTTAAVLAWRLARDGERVLVVDLDLESPGLSTALLEPNRRPQFGVTDWFVEDLVGQGDRVIDDMVATPAWAQDFDGHVHVVPAHGVDAGDYLAKLGRVYMSSEETPWTKRLDRWLGRLEARFTPDIVLLESRSGLHDIAAATVTDLDADVLLFAADSESTWTDYDILFRHWNNLGLAEGIRERLSVVSALTPVPDRETYRQRFRLRAWDLFREHLYDELSATAGPDDGFSFDLDDAAAPHSPMEVSWTLGLAAGVSLRTLNEATVNEAYGGFFVPFQNRMYTGSRRDAS